MEDSSEICRPSGNLQNCRSPQLFIDDTGWDNIERIFEHERLKPTIIRTNHRNVQNLAELRQIMNTDLRFN